MTEKQINKKINELFFYDDASISIKMREETDIETKLKFIKEIILSQKEKMETDNAYFLLISPIIDSVISFRDFVKNANRLLVGSPEHQKQYSIIIDNIMKAVDDYIEEKN